MLNLSKEVIKAMEKRRMYSGEFKSDAVSLTLKNEKTVKETAEDLDIPYSILCKWRTQYNKYGENAFPGNGNIKESEKDLRALERELRIVKQERDILKKALAIFSKHPDRSMSL